MINISEMAPFKKSTLKIMLIRQKKTMKNKSSGRSSDAAKDVKKKFCKYFDAFRIVWENSNNNVFDDGHENSDSPVTD